MLPTYDFGIRPRRLETGIKYAQAGYMSVQLLLPTYDFGKCPRRLETSIKYAQAGYMSVQLLLPTYDFGKRPKWQKPIYIKYAHTGTTEI